MMHTTNDMMTIMTASVKTNAMATIKQTVVGFKSSEAASISGPNEGSTVAEKIEVKLSS